MRRGLVPLVSGMLLILAFVVYRFSGVGIPQRLDRVVQFVLLGPAGLSLAWFVSGILKQDLVETFRRRLLAPSTFRFLVTIGLFMLVFTIWMVYEPLEGIPKGGDEAAYFFQSKIFAAGHFSAPSPSVEDPRTFFPFRHFIFDEQGRWFIMYTPIHSIFMAPFTAAGLAPLLGPFEGLLSLVGMFLLLRAWMGEARARAAALLLVLSPFYLLLSSSFMAHNSNLMLVVWALYFITRMEQGGGYLNGSAGGLLLGLALCTKPYPIVWWAIFLTAALLAKHRMKAIPRLAAITAGAVPPVLLLLGINWFYTGSPFRLTYNLARWNSLIGFGPHKAWSPSYGDYAHTPLRGILNVAQQVGVGSVALFGWPLVSGVPILAALFAVRNDRRILWLFGLLLMSAGFMTLHYSASVDYGPRHYYTLVPVLMALTVVGFSVLLTAAHRKWHRRGGSFVILSTGAMFLISLFLYMPGAIRLRSGAWQAIDNIPAAMTEERIDVPAVVFMQASEHGYPHIVSGINHVSPWLDGDIIYCAHQTVEDDLSFMGAYPGRNPYLFWFDGIECHLETWTAQLAEDILPERDMVHLRLER